MTDPQTDALFLQANELVLAEDTGSALALLDDIAARAGRNGCGVDQARALRLGAMVARLYGDIAGAITRGVACGSIDSADPVTKQNATVELAAMQLAAGDAKSSRASLQRATQMVPPSDIARRVELQRQLSAISTALGRPAEALRALNEARKILPDYDVTAAKIALEVATLAHAAGDPSTRSLVDKARLSATRSGDHGCQAGVALLEATLSLDAHRPEEALDALRKARRLARLGTAPIEYVAACLGIARVADRIGDRPTAYESLAVGWATLSDLMGPVVAEETFSPELRHLREHWGATTFAVIRADYEARRHAEQ